MTGREDLRALMYSELSEEAKDVLVERLERDQRSIDSGKTFCFRCHPERLQESGRVSHLCIEHWKQSVIEEEL